MMRKTLAHLSLTLILCLPVAALAQVMRCGEELVQPGDTKEQVVQACGEPDYTEGNRWFYNTRTNQPRIVVFNAVGLVETIEIVW